MVSCFRRQILCGLAIFIFTVAFEGVAYAWPPSFGPEFTFTNEAMIKAAGSSNQVVTAANMAKMEEWRRKVEEKCAAVGGCKVSATKDKHGPAYRIEYSDGFWYQVSLDDSVVEVQTKPNTVEGFKKLRDRIQEAVFDFAKTLEMTPHARIGGGHLNVGLDSGFGSDAKLFRNFFVDEANHPELHLGVLGIAKNNGPTIFTLGGESLKSLKKVLREFDARPTDLFELARRIETDVYTSTPHEGWGPKYYQNLRFDGTVEKKLALDERRVEVRGVRPQVSIDEFILEAELYEHRLGYLRKLTGPLALQVPAKDKMSPGELKARYNAMLRRIGADEKKFEALLPSEIRSATANPAVIPFNESHVSSVTPRANYGPVIEVSSRLSDVQIKEFEKLSADRSSGPRGLHHVPRVLSAAEHELLVNGANQRARAFKALYEDLRSGHPSAVTAKLIPANMLSRLLGRAETTTDELRSTPWSNTGFSHDPDIVRASDGTFRILEDNLSLSGSLADAADARRDLLKLIPKYQEILKDGPQQGVASVVAASLKEKLKIGEAAVLILPFGSVEKNRSLIKQLRALGVTTITEKGLENYSMTAAADGRLFLVSPTGSRLPIGAAATGGFTSKLFAEKFPDAKKAFADGKLVILGYPSSGVKVLSDGELLPFIEKLIPHYLHEEPILRAVPTFTFQGYGRGNRPITKKDDLEKVFLNLDDYVFKDANVLADQRIYIGSKLSKAGADELKMRVKANPGAWFAQEYVPVSQFDDHIVGLHIYSVVTSDGVRTAEQISGTALAIHADGRLNGSRERKSIPVFIEGRDSVSLGTIKIPDDPRQLKSPRSSVSQCSGMFRRLVQFFKKN